MSSVVSKGILCSMLVASPFAVLGIACSSSGNEGVAPDEGGTPSTPLETDSGDASVAIEADSATDADAQAGRCSADDVCHTVLPPNTSLRDVWSAGDGVVWAAGFREPPSSAATGTVLRWDGSAWAVQLETEKPLYAVWGSGPADLWIGGEDGLFHGTGTSSAATSWKKLRSEPITSIWGTSADDVWAVGSIWQYPYTYAGTVLHFEGAGADGSDGWKLDPLASRAAAFRRVWGTSTSDVWIAANERSVGGTSQGLTLHRRSDGHGGFTWSDAPMPNFVSEGSDVLGGAISGGGSIGTESVWLLGNMAHGHDVLFRGVPKTDDSGDYAWSKETFGTCRTGAGQSSCLGLWLNHAVWGKSPNDVYLAGDFGQLRHWDGTSYSFVKTTVSKIPLRASFFAMWGASNTDLWIVGDQIALHKVAPQTP